MSDTTLDREDVHPDPLPRCAGCGVQVRPADAGETVDGRLWCLGCLAEVLS